VVTAALVLLAGALLLAGHLRDDPYLVALALGLSLAAVVVESVQVLRARRDLESSSVGPEEAASTPVPDEPDEPDEPAPTTSVVEPVEPTPTTSVVEPVETTPTETADPAGTEPAGEPADEPADEPTPVRLPGRTTYHRPDCATVRGKAVAPLEPGAEPGEVLKPCGRCRPTPPARVGDAGGASSAEGTE